MKNLIKAVTYDGNHEYLNYFIYKDDLDNLTDEQVFAVFDYGDGTTALKKWYFERITDAEAETLEKLGIAYPYTVHIRRLTK